MNPNHDKVSFLHIAAAISLAASIILLIENRRLNRLLGDAVHDHLTGLHTRKQLMKHLKRLEAGGAKSLPLSIIFIDVDGLKPINDEFGHRAGDLHLKTIANIIELNTHSGDISGRFGGDEFLIALSNTDFDEATLVAERLRCICESTPSKHPLSVSIGVATRWDVTIPIDQVIHESDERMYEEKERKKIQSL